MRVKFSANRAQVTEKNTIDKKIPKARQVINERTQKHLEKYSHVGELKRKLYSMPDYVRSRDQKGVKLPESKIKSAPHRFPINLNISKVRG